MPIVLIKCAHCGEEFDSGGHHLRVYCNPVCRNRANRLKERLKYKAAALGLAPKAINSLVDPKPEVLDAAVAMLRAGGVPEIEIVGALPQWQAPEDIFLQKVPGNPNDLPRWSMIWKGADEEDIVAAALRSLGGDKP